MLHLFLQCNILSSAHWTQFVFLHFSAGKSSNKRASKLAPLGSLANCHHVLLACLKGHFNDNWHHFLTNRNHTTITPARIQLEVACTYLKISLSTGFWSFVLQRIFISVDVIWTVSVKYKRIPSTVFPLACTSAAILSFWSPSSLVSFFIFFAFFPFFFLCVFSLSKGHD